MWKFVQFEATPFLVCFFTCVGTHVWKVAGVSSAVIWLTSSVDQQLITNVCNGRYTSEWCIETPRTVNQPMQEGERDVKGNEVRLIYDLTYLCVEIHLNLYSIYAATLKYYFAAANIVIGKRPSWLSFRRMRFPIRFTFFCFLQFTLFCEYHL